MSRNDVENLPGMVGRHPSMLEMYELVRKAAPSPLPIVVEGKTGTGKELVAAAVHLLSGLPPDRIIDLNCAAIPENLIESELFGWVRGAFTGALTDRAGLLECANGGTLFLDEATAIPRTVQSKLLRTLETGQVRRLGSNENRITRFRLVMAIERSLHELVSDGSFVLSFAQRVDGVTVILPPLSQRQSDIRPLAVHFLQVDHEDRTIFTEEALTALELLPFCGNVRELRSLVARCVLHADGKPISGALVTREAHSLGENGEITDERLREAVRASGGNLSRASGILGIPRSTLRDRLSRISGVVASAGGFMTGAADVSSATEPN